MRYLIVFQYDGSRFHGFQRQNDVKNVQGTLENCLTDCLNQNIVIKGSGRTDAGVHAIYQTAHFDVDKKIAKDFKNVLNQKLNGEIVIKKVKLVKKDFHARFSVKKKIYRYVISLDKNNIDKKYSYTSLVDLNILKMKEASLLFLGCHDFRNFVSGQRDDYTTYIYKIKIKKINKKIIFEFVGTGFYRYMIRHLVGALYDVGREKISKDVIQEMLLYPTKRRQLTVMPAYGLYLVKVKY